MIKTRVAVLMGGTSSEHEVSLLSGQQVVKNLDENKYEILPVIISKNGQWQITSKEKINKLSNPISGQKNKNEKSLIKINDNNFLQSNLSKKVDIAFIALHGSFGEDGVIQGILDFLGIKYTGSGLLPSSIGMDKNIFRKIMKSEGLLIPEYLSVNKKYNADDVVKKLGNFPYVVKPSNGGSSVGVSLVNSLSELKKGIDKALEYDHNVLIDKYIKGRELTCAVIENNGVKALPIIEIKPLKGSFFNYESKYTESGAEEIVPAKISKKIEEKIKEMSIKVFKSINCRGFGRVDFILNDRQEPVILEINTIPGLTSMSLLPKAALAAGISYTKLLDIIINNAIN